MAEAGDGAPSADTGRNGKASDNSSRALGALRARVKNIGSHEGAAVRLPPERDLAAELGIGRRAVRRALEVLETEGLIWRRQGKGTFVGPRPSDSPDTVSALVDRTNPEEVLEARMQLEPALAALAALRADRQDVRRMRDLCDRLARASDDDARELWDEALHRTIGRAAGNTLLFGLYEIIEEVRRDDAWRSLRERARSKAMVATYVEQHAAIVDAIARRDPGAAEHAMRVHIATLRRSILSQDDQEAGLVG
ncbi:MAG: FadR family transcriptional regulator [Salinarimonas sp.]|nr:FadR family transcriptional regulator [Salinarimonas sp.]